MSFEHSLRQARTITQYWKAKGFTVEPRLEAIPGRGIIEPHYTVRSDMLNGLPRDYTDKPPRAYEEQPGEFVWEKRGRWTVNTSVQR